MSGCYGLRCFDQSLLYEGFRVCQPGFYRVCGVPELFLQCCIEMMAVPCSVWYLIEDVIYCAGAHLRSVRSLERYSVDVLGVSGFASVLPYVEKCAQSS
jgi:hypothetical protein